MELWIGALNLGLIFSFLAVGVYLTFKIYNIADLSIDGTFTLGAAVSSILIINNFNPFIAIFISFVFGAIAGIITGVIHTKLKINSLIACILMLTALYSINLEMMGKANISLANNQTMFKVLDLNNPIGINEIWYFIFLSVFVIAFIVLVTLFLKSDLGIIFRASGNNPVMVSAYGFDKDKFIILSFALGNGFVAISGSLFGQYQGFSDIGMGIGMIVVAFAAIIVGESLIRNSLIFFTILRIVFGVIILRLIVALALYIGVDQNLLKLIIAVFVLIALVSTDLLKNKKSVQQNLTSTKFGFLKSKAFISVSVVLILIISYFSYTNIFYNTSGETKRVAIFRYISNNLTDKTLEGVENRLNKSGILKKYNLQYDAFNANGDYITAQSIAQNIVSKKYDYIITITTIALQTMFKHNTGITHVFCSVTDPIASKIIKGLNDKPPYLTGIATPQPVESTIKIMRELLPNAKEIGIIWNPAEINSELTTIYARESCKKYNFILTEELISNVSEITESLNSLIDKKIDIFLTAGDLTVSSVIPSISVKLRKEKIPYFTNNFVDINNGTFISIGADYYEVGIRAAEIFIRLLNGENPKDIPVEKYVPEAIAINLKLANEYGIKIPDSLKAKSNIIIK